jgi:hypothetical protein
MKKVFILIISIMLAISISACGGNKTDSPDISTVDSNNYMELPDEDPEEDIVDTKATKISDSITDKFKEFSDAETEFDHHVYEISHKVETVSLHQNAVMITDMKVLDHMLPLYLWGETLDDTELAEQDIATSVFEGEDRSFRKYDLERESENRYRVTMETHDDQLIISQIDYYPDLDALRLETVNNGSLELVFEYAKIKDGYAAQYYFETIIGGTYGAPKRAMCAYKTVFSGLKGSKARFEDVEEPPSIIGNVPKEEDIIKGATDWLTIKDGNITGELRGESF